MHLCLKPLGWPYMQSVSLKKVGKKKKKLPVLKTHLTCLKPIGCLNTGHGKL